MLEESHKGETFFTSVGCMDGRVQKAVNRYASLIFGGEFADTITKAGLVGLFADKKIDKDLFDSVKNMVAVSVDKHKSFGIIVHGHEGCAGNPVGEKEHISDIKASVKAVKKMVVGKNVVVRGVYIKLNPRLQVIEVV